MSTIHWQKERFIYKQTWNFYVLVEDLLEVVPCEAQFLAFHYLQLDEVVQFIVHVEDEGLIDLSAEAEDDSLLHLQGVRADSQVKESCWVSSNGHCILIDVCKKRTCLSFEVLSERAWTSVIVLSKNNEYLFCDYILLFLKSFMEYWKAHLSQITNFVWWV